MLTIRATEERIAAADPTGDLRRNGTISDRIPIVESRDTWTFAGSEGESKIYMRQCPDTGRLYRKTVSRWLYGGYSIQYCATPSLPAAVWLNI